MSPGIVVIAVTLLGIATMYAFLVLGELRAEGHQRRLFTRAMLKMLDRRLDEDDKEFRVLMLEAGHHMDQIRALPAHREEDRSAEPKDA
jgi:hypothetical protein